jgi:hypothetical protein
MFADDLKVAGDVTTSDDVANVQSDLDAISEWSVANELPISLPKCCALHYGSSNSKHQYVLSGQRINSVSECADLGVLRSDTFTFQPHVRAVALKAARLVCCLRTCSADLRNESPACPAYLMKSVLMR